MPLLSQWIKKAMENVSFSIAFLVHHLKPKLNQGSVWAFCFSYGFFAVGADGGLCNKTLLKRVGSVVGFHAIDKQLFFEELKNYAVAKAKV